MLTLVPDVNTRSIVKMVLFINYNITFNLINFLMIFIYFFVFLKFSYFILTIKESPVSILDSNRSKLLPAKCGFNFFTFTIIQLI